MFRLFTLGARLSFLLVLLNFALTPFGDLSAQSYWDALFELGFEPTTKKVNQVLACRRIEGIHRLRELISHHLTAEQNLFKLIRKLDSRVTSLDVANVYDFLPFSDASGHWRALGIRGQTEFNLYRLNAVDPNIQKWLNSSSDDYTVIAGSQDQLGDIGFGIFIRPIRKDTYKFLTEFQLYLDDIPAVNIMRVINGILTTTWSYAATAANLPVAADIKPKKTLNRQSLKILSGIYKDFPDLSRIVSHYCDVENVVTLIEKTAADSLAFNLRVRLNHDALSMDYPEISKLFKKWREIVKFRARIFDQQDQLMGILQFDSTHNLFSMQFRILRDRFLPVHANQMLKLNNGFNFLDEGLTQFRVDSDIQLNIVGMHLEIGTLPVVLKYRHSDGGPLLNARMAQIPQKLEASGSVYGIIPVWALNLMIPSNVQDIMFNFFQTLVGSNDGNGFVLMIHSYPDHSSKQFFMLNTNAEVLANGTLKLGFNLQRNFFAMPPELLIEIQAFRNRLWNAFYSDFQSIKAQRGYQQPH